MPEKVVPLRLRTLVDDEGVRAAQPFVRCPQRDQSVDAASCTGCGRLRGFEWSPDKGGSVTCDVDEDAPAVDRRADLGELAARSPVHEILSPVTTCVPPDLSLSGLERVMAERGCRCVGVVDEDGKLQGLVSRTDLATAADFGCVADVVPQRVHALPEDAPIGYAIALMAFADVSEVPVVRDDGTLIGICHALDVMRWVARRLGYVVPGPERALARRRSA